MNVLGSSRASAIRRSQTFSPACRQGDSYVCKVSHVDVKLARGLKGDYCMHHYKTFEPRQANLCLRAFRHDKF